MNIDTQSKKSAVVPLKHLALTAATLIVLGFVYWYLNDTIFSLQTREFNTFIDGLGWKAPLVMIGLTIVEVVVAPLPGGWIAIADGFIFGHWLGFLYSYIGSVIGSWIAFELARKLGQPFVQKMISAEKYEQYEKKIHTSRWGIILLYMIPLFPVDIVSLLIGLTNVRRKRFIVLMMIGLLPNMFVLNFFGSQISNPSYQYVLIGLAAIVVLYFVINWFRIRHTPKSS